MCCSRKRGRFQARQSVDHYLLLPVGEVLLAPCPDNRGWLKVGLVSLLCEGVPGSTNKTTFSIKGNIDFFLNHFMCEAFVFAQYLPANLKEAFPQKTYWQNYLHEWSWNVTRTQFRSVFCLEGSKATAARTWLMRHSWAVCATRGKCKGGHSVMKGRSFMNATLLHHLSFLQSP